MLSSTFALRASSFSRLHVPPGKSDSLRRYYCVVPISEIPLKWEDWLEVNARDSSNKGRVPMAIRQTLNDKPEWFAEYNRGLTIVASKLEWDNKAKQLVLEFKDRQYNGVLDGGHTLRAVLDMRSKGDQQEGYCNIEIFTGLEESEIPSVVDARNTSKQVASKSLMNLEGRFEKLKEAIGTEKAELISWKENEDGELDVREFIGMLTALEKDTLDSIDTHPVRAYSGKESCLRSFASPSAKVSYEKLLKIAPDVLEMWDAIQYYLPSQYNEKHGRFGGLTGVRPLKENKARKLPFIKEITTYDIPTGYVYPILAAFRAFLVEEDGYWVWDKELNPLDLIENSRLATNIFMAAVRDSINAYHNPNRTGKDPQVWAVAYLTAENYFLRQ